MSWQSNDGDSLTGPMFAGAMAIVRDAMVDHGIPADRPLGPALYAIASDPVAHEAVFMDVINGTNDLRSVGCCSAGHGYDLVTGLGEVRFTALYRALASAAVVPAPSPPAPTPAVVPAFTG